MPKDFNPLDPLGLFERSDDPKTESPWKKEVDARRAEIIALLEGALSYFKEEKYSSALWRVVDAAGLIGVFTDPSAQGKPSNPTGRGYFIDNRYHRG